VFTPTPIGYVRSPYTSTKTIPKGLGVKHDEEGILDILPEFELGLSDIEGFSHLFVIWAFDRSDGFDLFGPSPTDDRPHGVFATRSPRRPNPIALTVVELLSPAKVLSCTSAVSTCSTARLSSTSSPICPASPPRNFAAAG
jgi:tRNA (adenine37-N6)-methyltransferase